MDNFGAKEDAEAVTSNFKPEMSSDRQPMQKRRKQSAYESDQRAEASSNKAEKRGPKPKLTPDEKHKNKIASGRKYREKKAAEKKTLQEKYDELKKEHEELKKKLEYGISEAENETLQKKYQDLEKENEELTKKEEEKQLEINMLKEQLSEIFTQADKLQREVSDESIKVNGVKMVNKVQETEMQQLQEQFLNQDGQQHDAENFEIDIPMDYEYLNKFLLEGLDDFSDYLNSKSSKTKGGLSSGEGSSSAKAISLLQVEVDEEIRVTEDKLKGPKESKSKRTEERKSKRQRPM